MPATTIDTIAAAFRTAIEATVPRMVEGNLTHTWKFAEGDTPPRADARWFHMEWDGEGDTPNGFMGPIEVDTTCTCSVIVDYGGIPKHRVKILAVDDLHQLRDVLNRLKSSSTGLRWVELVDWAFVNNDRNQARVSLQYEVRYMKARG